MQRVHLPLSVLVISASAALVSLPNIDSHGYWKGQSRAELELLNEAVTRFAAENSRIPTTEEGLNALIAEPTNVGTNSTPHIRKSSVVKDYWGSPYVYKVIDLSQKRFVIYSAGPNGNDDNQDYDDVTLNEKEYPCRLYHDCYTLRDYVFFCSLALGAVALFGLALALINRHGNKHKSAA